MSKKARQSSFEAQFHCLTLSCVSEIGLRIVLSTLSLGSFFPLFALIGTGTVLLAVNKQRYTTLQARPLQGCCALINGTADGLSWGSLQCHVAVGFVCVCVISYLSLVHQLVPYGNITSLADWMALLKLVGLQRGGQREGKACNFLSVFK